MEPGQMFAIFLSVFVALIAGIALPLVLTGERARAAQEQARSRRLTDARMNARLLRLNL
jgi:hypothetical protein